MRVQGRQGVLAAQGGEGGGALVKSSDTYQAYLEPHAWILSQGFHWIW